MDIERGDIVNKITKKMRISLALMVIILGSLGALNVLLVNHVFYWWGYSILILAIICVGKYKLCRTYEIDTKYMMTLGFILFWVYYIAQCYVLSVACWN